MRRSFFVLMTLASVVIVAASWWSPWTLLGMAVVLPLFVWGLVDALQTGDNVRRNFPVVGSILELLRAQRHVPQEDLLQTSWEGRPFSHLQRRIVRKRASGELQSEAFGTEMDYAAVGHEWFLTTLYPIRHELALPRVRIGDRTCAIPYEASLLNVSAMSFGSISAAAIRALGGAAREEDFALNTGEGGLTDHHLDTGAALIWQIGTGYFGCRDGSGRFDPAAFEERGKRPEVKMIEIKLSQGAKPGFGAILPASKNSEEVAKYRLIDPHEEVLSPPHHEAFGNDHELLDFIQRLRDLSGGKPVGIKICPGPREEIRSLCATMAEKGRWPDFMTVVGGEGGTGAGELESIHHAGAPSERNWRLVDLALREVGLRDSVRILAAGKIVTGFDIARALALGADACYSARGMMFALGCVQSLKCNTNRCPTGITTMDPSLTRGLVVEDKTVRVARFHRETLAGLSKLLRAGGLTSPGELRRDMFHRRIGPAEIRSLDELPEV